MIWCDIIYRFNGGYGVWDVHLPILDTVSVGHWSLNTLGPHQLHLDLKSTVYDQIIELLFTGVQVRMESNKILTPLEANLNLQASLEIEGFTLVSSSQSISAFAARQLQLVETCHDWSTALWANKAPTLWIFVVPTCDHACFGYKQFLTWHPSHWSFGLEFILAFSNGLHRLNPSSQRFPSRLLQDHPIS